MPQRLGPGVDLYLATIDGRGRLPLRRSATTIGWSPRHELSLAIQDSVLRLSGQLDPAAGEPLGIGVGLDDRFRVVLPYGIRVTTGFRPGVRLVVLTMRREGVVAALPLANLVDALVGGQ